MRGKHAADRILPVLIKQHVNIQITKQKHSIQSMNSFLTLSKMPLQELLLSHILSHLCKARFLTTNYLRKIQMF